ncbi:MAG: ATP-binding protein [Halobacteriaceae archaeon]
MTDDGGEDLYTPAQFREHAEGYGQRDPEVREHTGRVQDPQLSRYLSILSQEYDPSELPTEVRAAMPARVESTEMYRRTLRNESTAVAREAMDHGDTQTLKLMTGDANQRADISGMQALMDVEDLLDREAILWYIFAPPGSGKTDFACLAGQLWKRTHPGGEVASNIRTLRESDEWIANYPDVMDWFKQDQDAVMNGEGTHKLFIFDEASSHASGRGKSGAEAGAKLAPLVYKVRKYGGSIIIVGHDGGDVHPAIRVMAEAVHKEGKKSATIYETVKNRKGRGQILSIDGIPPTDWRYNDKEATAWEWERPTGDDGTPDPETAAWNVAVWTVVRCKRDGLSDRDTAAYVPFGKSWVNSRWEEWQDGEHREAVDSVEELTG